MSRKKSPRIHPADHLSSPLMMPEGYILNPFRIAVDTNEISHGENSKDWKFEGFRSNADRGSKLLHVPLIHRPLDEGDYEVDGFPGYVLERKSKQDLFASIGNRENFKERLEYLQANYRSSAIIVECEVSGYENDPPKFRDKKTGLWRVYPPVKTVNRSITSWAQEYPTVHWWFFKDARRAEAGAFRALEKHWEKSIAGQLATQGIP